MNAVQAHDLNYLMAWQHTFDDYKFHYPLIATVTQVIEKATIEEKQNSNAQTKHQKGATPENPDDTYTVYPL